MCVQVFRALVESTKGIRGAKVESHKFCASVHYRNVEKKVRKKITFLVDRMNPEVINRMEVFWVFAELACYCSVCP